jgi:hypothetical protein
MLNENFIWIALAITVAGNFFYVRDTLKGETKPNRVTFILWSAAPFIAFLSQHNAGGSKQILYTLIISIVPLLIFFASFIDKKAYWKITKFDIYCGVVSLIALAFLVFTGRPLLALFLSIAADFFAALPTVIKSYKFPDTETITAYAAEIVSSIIVLLTVHQWIIVNYLFAAYILFMCTLFTSLLIFSPNKKSRILKPSN